METSDMEKFWIWMMRKNASTPILEIKKKIKIWRVTATFRWRSKKNNWGRFGGGWNWKLGVTIGSTTAVVHLLIAEISFCYSGEKA